MAQPNYLTPLGAKKLQSELRKLAAEERPKVVSEVADAAAQGDRSENAEYTYGKKRLREIDRRIRFLSKRLENAVIVDASAHELSTVRFGASVRVVDEEGIEKNYQLVGPDESEPEAGFLSYQSPMGRALMKKQVGDIVVVRRPIGEIEYEILTITYE